MAQLAKIITPETINVLPTKPAPPPHPVQHVASVVHNVVCPPQESCSKRVTVIFFCGSTTNVIHCASLPIVFPSIPESGAKSRVETQVRITVDLAHASSSQGPFLKYDRVGSWKCLKLPPNTSTKRRTRKDGKIGMIDHPISASPSFTHRFLIQDAAPQETLQLTAEVTCSSQPQMRVAVCSSCQSREVPHNFCPSEIPALIDIRRNVRPVKLHQEPKQMQRTPLPNGLMPRLVCSNSTAQRNSTSPPGLRSFPCASHAIVGIIAKKLDLMSISRWLITRGESWAQVRRLQS